MKAFRALLGLSFKSLLLTTFNFGRGKKNRGKAATGIGALLFLVGIMAYLSGTYSFMLAQGLAPYGGLDIMVMLITMMATVFPFIYTLYAAQSMVFSTKDIDLVLSLPVSSFSVMLARLLALYLESLLMVEVMLIPAGVAYLVYGGSDGVGFMLLLILVGILLAFLPTLLALIFGAVISLLVSRTRFKNFFNILFSLLLVIGIMVLSFSISFTANSTYDMTTATIDGLRAQIVGSMPPLGWTYSAMQGHLPSLLLLAVFLILPFLGVTWVFSRFYKSILTHLSSHYMRTDYKLKTSALRTRGSFSALLAKETRRFFGTPALVLNAGMGVMLAVVASVAAVIFKGTISEFLTMITTVSGNNALLAYLPPVLLACICFFSCMNYSSSVSISLEGKTLWILKEAPLSTGKIFATKAGFSFILTGLITVMSVPLLTYAFNLPLASAAVMLVTGLFFSLFTALLGLVANLWLPRLDAENETIIIKQSASMLVTMLLSMVALGGLALLYILLHHLGFLLFGAIASAVLLGLSALLILLLRTSGRKIFAQL